MTGSIEQEPCRPHQRYKHQYHLGKEDLRNSNVQCVDKIQWWEDNLAWVFWKYQAKPFFLNLSPMLSPAPPPRSQKLFSIQRYFQAFCWYHKIAAKTQSSVEFKNLVNKYFFPYSLLNYSSKNIILLNIMKQHTVFRASSVWCLFCILGTFYSHK